MLSSVSDQAVGAVGTANTYIGMFIMTFSIISSGMMAVMSFLNQMDSDGLNVTARSYTSQITNFSYCIGAALAQANAIMTGWRVGAKEYDLCDKATKKVAIIGILIATLVETVLRRMCPCYCYVYPLANRHLENKTHCITQKLFFSNTVSKLTQILSHGEVFSVGIHDKSQFIN